MGMNEKAAREVPRDPVEHEDKKLLEALTEEPKLPPNEMKKREPRDNSLRKNDEENEDDKHDKLLRVREEEEDNDDEVTLHDEKLK